MGGSVNSSTEPYETEQYIPGEDLDRYLQEGTSAVRLGKILDLLTDSSQEPLIQKHLDEVIQKNTDEPLVLPPRANIPELRASFFAYDTDAKYALVRDKNFLTLTGGKVGVGEGEGLIRCIQREAIDEMATKWGAYTLGVPEEISTFIQRFQGDEDQKQKVLHKALYLLSRGGLVDYNRTLIPVEVVRGHKTTLDETLGRFTPIMLHMFALPEGIPETYPKNKSTAGKKPMYIVDPESIIKRATSVEEIHPGQEVRTLLKVPDETVEAYNLLAEYPEWYEFEGGTQEEHMRLPLLMPNQQRQRILPAPTLDKHTSTPATIRMLNRMGLTNRKGVSQLYDVHFASRMHYHARLPEPIGNKENTQAQVYIRMGTFMLRKTYWFREKKSHEGTKRERRQAQRDELVQFIEARTAIHDKTGLPVFFPQMEDLYLNTR